jgi:hypothetical protein
MRRNANLWLTLLWLSVASRALAQAPPSDQQQEQQAPAVPPPPPAEPAPQASWAPPLPVEPVEEEQPQTAGPPGTPAAEPPEQTAPPPPLDPEEAPTEVEIYGFAMLDIGYDFGKIGDPLWQDVVRPTKLPAFPNEFGKGGRTFESVRQSRFGVATKHETSAGEIQTRFEFELFGTGVDEGQTTFRLRHFYGDWRGIRAGQTWSPFMDPDVFPNSIEYWGPNGMVFFRNVQIQYRPWVSGDSYAVVALERPGASADQGRFAEDVLLEDVVGRFPAPDVSANIHYAGPWGHVQAAAIFRYIKWDDLAVSPTVEGHAYGWGVNLSANVKLAPTLLKLQAVYGRAIENYMNDGGADIGPEPSNDPAQPIRGKALPILGLVGFVDIDWNANFTSTAGYSFVWVDNSSGQAPDAFHIGHYALGNILWHPVKKLFLGPEFQFGRRQNNSDGFSANDYRVQFSINYKFSATTEGK